MKKVKQMFISLFTLTLISSCGSLLPAQKVSLDAKSITAIKAVKSKSVKKSRSDRFMDCLKDLNFEGIKQTLIVGACEAAMGSIR